MKKFLAAVLIFSMAVSVAGCATTPAATESTSKNTDSAAQSTNTAVPEATEGQVTLQFLNHKVEADTTFKELIAEFEKQNPDIKIELNTPPDSETVLATMAANGALPDLWTELPSTARYKEYAKNGLMLDMTDSPLLDNVLPNVLELARLDDGKIYTLPISLNTYGVFYSTEIFENLSLTPPTNYEEFITVCDKIKTAGITPLVFSDKDAWTADHMFAFTSGDWVPGYMETYEEVLAGKTHLTDNAAVVSQAQRLLDLRDNYGQPNTLGTGYSDAVDSLTNGKSAMYMQGIWAIPAIRAANPDFSFGLFPVPHEKAEDTTVMMAIDCAIDISSGSKYPEQAMKFAAFLSSVEGASKYSELDRSPSAIKDVKVALGEADPLVKYISEGKTHPQLFNLHTTDISVNEAAVVQNLFVEKDPAKFVQALDELWFGKKS